MLALSIREPYVELILQGRKRIEYRTMNVKKMLGERSYLDASKKERLEGCWPCWPL
jgi:ASC-1-like (ASCH) protein